MPDLPETPGAIESTLGIGSEVKDIYETDDGVIVNVFITSPKPFPFAIREARAKSKAVQAVGVADVSVNTLDDMIKMRRIERLAEVKEYKVFEDQAYIRDVGSRFVLDKFDVSKVELVAFEVLVNAEKQ